MTSVRFDEIDRRAVIDSLSRQLGVRLTVVGRRRKWLKDEFQRHYWVIGGYGEWHGIPAEMMDAEVASPSGGILAIAMRLRQAIQIYVSPLAPFVDARSALNRARKTTGDYQFTYTKRGIHLVIDQAPSIALSDLTGFSFDDTAKTAVKKSREAEKLIAALPENELRALLTKLRH